MRRALVATALLSIAGCYSPDIASGNILCAEPGDVCPSGYACQVGRCYRNGTVLDLSAGVGESDLALDDGGAGDGGVAGADMRTPVVFPSAPILDGTLPPNIAQQFGAASGTLAGPCLLEPALGSLLPQNFAPLRIHFTPTDTTNQVVFEIRVHHPSQPNDLLVYSNNTQWTFPAELWVAMRASIVDSAFTVTVRAAALTGNTISGVTAASSAGSFTIAPVAAPGAIVYWTASPLSLVSVKVSDTTVSTLLAPVNVTQPASTSCVACHAAAPDGASLGLVATATGAGVPVALSGAAATLGKPFSFATGAATMALSMADPSPFTFSSSLFSTGAHFVLARIGTGATASLATILLEAGSSPSMTLARTGDGRGAWMPTWSHDGTRIVYVSADVQSAGQSLTGGADLYAVPFNNRAGGPATPVAGAATATKLEYQPAFSPDDAWLAFNAVPTSETQLYNVASGELFVIPSTGGTATRLAANDPPACSGVSSPGVTNSWPRWSPAVTTHAGSSYYWLTFSSRRYGAQGQIFVTPIVVSPSGVVSTFPAVYLSAQPAVENHTPDWSLATGF